MDDREFGNPDRLVQGRHHDGGQYGLRISQSAVSKRIAALERYYDRDLIERHGRRVVLTHHGTRLVERVTPLLSELRSVFLATNALCKGKIILGVSEAILASWGSTLFLRSVIACPGWNLNFMRNARQWCWTAALR